jgi:phenylpyruvate tautomerase PptA (4-oxalocrotonate tautomerase family)
MSAQRADGERRLVHGASVENPRVPVIRIRALPRDGVDERSIAASVARAVAAELDEDPRGTWVTWETVDAYAEGGVVPSTQPDDTHPPLAEIRSGPRPPDVVSRMLRAVGDTLVAELGLEQGNVFVVFDEVDPARLYDADR